MKKIRNFVIAIIGLVLLAGCTMSEEVGFKVTSDKMVEVTAKVIIDNESLNSLLSLSSENTDATTITSEQRIKYLKENSCSDDEEEGTTCDVYEEGTNTVLVMKAKKVDIDTLTTTADVEKLNIAGMNNTSVSDSKIFRKSDDVYSSNLTYTLTGDGDLMSTYGADEATFKFAIELILPNKSISNNADKVSSDGLTLRWELDSKTSKDIEFSFKFDSSNLSNSTTEPTNNTTTKNTTTSTTSSSGDNLISQKADTILGMAKSTFIIVVCSVVGGLILLSILIIVFARKSTGAAKNTTNNSASQETAQLFKNPELNIQGNAQTNPTTTEPVQNSDSLTESVNDMTDTNKTE